MAHRLLIRIRMRARTCAWAFFAIAIGAAGGCGSVSAPRIVPLMHLLGAPLTQMPPNGTPLEVVSRGTAVPDPLPVRGSDIVYGDLESVLGFAVSSATVPWADAHREHVVAQHGGWTVLVEVIGADAEQESGGRIVVGLDVRVTLRTRNGNTYLGQTQLGCHEGGLRSAEDGAPVMYRCMMRIGRDLAGWLGGGVRLDPPPPGEAG
jgi:hypothetical protein